jgi:succinate dehydrogenase / fumarate reductase, membrane anchor subunit
MAGTEIGRVRGLGAAREGTHDWWMMRVTSVALLLLGAWLIASLVMLPNLSHAMVTAWIKQPQVAVPLVLFAAAAVHHQHHGLLELITDYVHDAGGNVVARLTLTAFSFAAGGIAVFSILKIAFGA